MVREKGGGGGEGKRPGDKQTFRKTNGVGRGKVAGWLGKYYRRTSADRSPT